MRFSLLPLSVLAATAVLAGPRASADLNPAIVSSDARWVVYADLNGLRQSAVGRELIAHLEKQGKHLVALPGATLTLDMPKVLATIGSITAYGANFTKDPKQVDGTLVIEGTADLRKILEALLLEVQAGNPAAVADIKDLGYSAYALNAPDKAPANDGHRVVIAFPPEGRVIVTQSVDRVRRARELASGGGNSLAHAPETELGALVAHAAHATVFAASVVPPASFFPQQGPHTRILQMTRSASVALGDDGTKTFAHIQLVAANDDSADKLVKILQGMTAMLSLTQSDDQKLMDFINSAQAGREGDRVTFQLAYDSAQLAAMVRRITEQPQPGHGPAMMAHGPHADAARILGQRMAGWEAAASGPAGSGAPAPAWQEIPGVRLTNGAEVTLQMIGVRPNAGLPLDEVRLTPGAGAEAPLTFSRKMMTELHRPMLGGAIHGYHLLQFAFPGEDGTYTLRVRFHPPAEGTVHFALWVKNDSGSDDRAATAPGP